MITVPLPYGGVRLEPETSWGVGAGELASALLIEDEVLVGAVVVIDGVSLTVMRDEGHPPIIDDPRLPGWQAIS
jgi:hypothetical protein